MLIKRIIYFFFLSSQAATNTGSQDTSGTIQNSSVPDQQSRGSFGNDRNVPDTQVRGNFGYSRDQQPIYDIPDRVYRPYPHHHHHHHNHDNVDQVKNPKPGPY